MTQKLHDRVALLVIDTQTNICTRFLGAKKAGQWQTDRPLPAWDVEQLRRDPHRYLGESGPCATA